VLGDARRLFGPAPMSGGFRTDSGLAASRDAVSQANGAAAETWSGAGASSYAATSRGQVTALDSLTGADQGTTAGSNGAANAATSGRNGMDAVITDTRTGVAAIAPSARTPAGQQQLINHLQSQLDRAKALLRVSERCNIAMATMIRNTVGGYRGATMMPSMPAMGAPTIMSGAAAPGAQLPPTAHLTAFAHHQPARPAGYVHSDPQNPLVPPSPSDKRAVAQYIYRAARAHGYSHEDAVAIVAYAIGESDLEPTISGGAQGGPGDANVVGGLFQEKPEFAARVGVDPSQRWTVQGNVAAYLSNLARNRDAGDIYDQLFATSQGGPIYTGGRAAMGPLVARAKQLLGAG